MQIGNWMRDKETRESVKVTSIWAVMTGYDRNGADGLVATAKLAEHFNVLDDPGT